MPNRIRVLLRNVALGALVALLLTALSPRAKAPGAARAGLFAVPHVAHGE